MQNSLVDSVISTFASMGARCTGSSSCVPPSLVAGVASWRSDRRAVPACSTSHPRCKRSKEVGPMSAIAFASNAPATSQFRRAAQDVQAHEVSSSDRQRPARKSHHVRPGGGSCRIPGCSTSHGTGLARVRRVAVASGSGCRRPNRSPSRRRARTTPPSGDRRSDLPRWPGSHGPAWLDSEGAKEAIGGVRCLRLSGTITDGILEPGLCSRASSFASGRPTPPMFAKAMCRQVSDGGACKRNRAGPGMV